MKKHSEAEKQQQAVTTLKINAGKQLEAVTTLKKKKAGKQLGDRRVATHKGGKATGRRLMDAAQRHTWRENYWKLGLPRKIKDRNYRCIKFFSQLVVSNAILNEIKYQITS